MKRIWDEFTTIATFQTARIKQYSNGDSEVVRTDGSIRIYAIGYWDAGTGTLRVDLSCQQVMAYTEPFAWLQAESRQHLEVLYGTREKTTRRIIALIAEYEEHVKDAWFTFGQHDELLTDEQIIDREQRKELAAAAAAAGSFEDIPF